MRTVAGVIFLICLPSFALSDVFTVSSVADSGPGTFRAAIERANNRPGLDKILFDQRVAGGTIRPLTELPPMLDIIEVDGDIDDDGRPDVLVKGDRQKSGNGISLLAQESVLRGLAIGAFSGRAILVHARNARIVSCYVGVGRDGKTKLTNVGGDILVMQSTDCTIGGETPQDRNVIKGGSAANDTCGIEISDSSSNMVLGNYIGVGADGVSCIGGGGTGILIRGRSSSGNRIGMSALTPCPNVLGGLVRGLAIGDGANWNEVYGNHFGLGADGASPTPIAQVGVALSGGAAYNHIGSFTTLPPNVFGNLPTGVEIRDPLSMNNHVEDNLFGCTPSGKNIAPITCGVRIIDGAEKQYIYGNVFLPTANSKKAFGVCLDSAGPGTKIEGNIFGLLPSGDPAPVPRYQMKTGIAVSASRAFLTANDISCFEQGVHISRSGFAWLAHNDFDGCFVAVLLDTGGRASLGDSTKQAYHKRGNNSFAGNAWLIRNLTRNTIKAENNSFGTTSKWVINARIWDCRDDPTLGCVDYLPLAGGVISSGGTMAVTAVTAISSRAGGAEITFSLSAPGEVHVSILNLAGRGVATPVSGRVFATGIHRVVWNGHTNSGVKVPNGVYLVCVRARDSEGREVSRVSLLSMRH